MALSTSRTMRPEKSIVPVWGRTRRTGASSGSVDWIRNRPQHRWPVGSNQLRRTRPRTSTHEQRHEEHLRTARVTNEPTAAEC